MIEAISDFERIEDVFTRDVSDEALEAAANKTPVAAVSFAGAPTVSILITCCSNDSSSAPTS